MTIGGTGKGIWTENGIHVRQYEHLGISIDENEKDKCILKKGGREKNMIKASQSCRVKPNKESKKY